MELRRREAVPLEEIGEGNLFPVMGLLGEGRGKELGFVRWDNW